MNEIKSSMFAAAGVVLAAGLIVTGTVVRDHVDVGSRVTNRTASLEGAVASREQVPEGDYFHELTKLLKKEYVEPINDDDKLAIGAVRGMVSSLGDPNSLFLDADAFRVHQKQLKGEYEGIGADLSLEVPGDSGKTLLLRSANDEDAPDPVTSQGSTIPKLVVAAVVPGGPADKAGVKPGDWVYSVDGHWVIDPDTANRFRDLQLKAMPGKNDPQAQEQFKNLRMELRPKMERSLMPLRARERLIEGTSGAVKIVWHRGDDLRATSIEKGSSKLTDFSANNDTIALPFEPSSAASLKKAIAGLSAVTIDLRNNVAGDSDEMRACLEVLAPAGSYGTFDAAKPEKTHPLTVKTGNPNPPKIKLLVDRTTRGPAEIFALALASKGIATLSGGGMDRHVYEIDTTSLAEGTGFTLVTGEYKPPKPVVGALRSADVVGSSPTLEALKRLGSRPGEVAK